MPATNSVQNAHADLHANGASQVNCPMCNDSAGFTNNESAREAAPVAADDKVFTEAQHFALLTSAVERETAQLTETKSELDEQVATLQSEKAALETSATELQNKLDVLESEKAAETARADAAVKEFEDFKSELAELTAVETRKAERLESVKAADATLGDDFFTDARVQRWAEMADEHFDSLVADLREAASAKKPAGEVTEPSSTEQARETAAFSGGETTSTKGSALGSYLTAAGLLPGARN